MGSMQVPLYRSSIWTTVEATDYCTPACGLVQMQSISAKAVLSQVSANNSPNVTNYKTPIMCPIMTVGSF